jgi:hypothetical protein
MQNENEPLLPEVIIILEALLRQVEQPQRQKVVRVRLNIHYTQTSLVLFK